jgi:hypothetical protein
MQLSKTAHHARTVEELDMFKISFMIDPEAYWLFTSQVKSYGGGISWRETRIDMGWFALEIEWRTK